MPTTTYFLRFTHSDRSEIELYEHRNESEAREHFDLFGPEDADIYSRIDLYAYDWIARTETPLDSKLLNQPA